MKDHTTKPIARQKHVHNSVPTGVAKMPSAIAKNTGPFAPPPAKAHGLFWKHAQGQPDNGNC